MVARNFPIAHKHVLAYEGGYSNHPADPGGVTLNGITQATDNAWRRAHGQPLRRLTAKLNGSAAWEAERDAIYRHAYWDALACDDLPAGVDAAIYDYGVNSGVGRAAKVLQRLVGVKVDRKIGPKTLDAVRARDPLDLVNAICAERLAFLRRLKTWPVFGKGWGRRVADVRDYAGALATATAHENVARSVTPLPKEAAAKGEVPAPKAAKTAAKAGPVVAVGSGLGMLDWIAAHPVATVAIAAAVIGAIVLINHWHRLQQEAPTPGIGVVPEAA